MRTSAGLTFEDVERQRSHGNANHCLLMIEELDRFDVQREIIVSLQREKNRAMERRVFSSSPTSLKKKLIEWLLSFEERVLRK